MLRELGLGIPVIAEVLDGQRDDTAALRTHLEWLGREKERLDRQIASVEKTIEMREGGGDPVAEDMFDGFDHRQYRDEVMERWGAESSAASDTWWTGMSAEQRREWAERTGRLTADWADAATRGVDPAAEEAQRLAHRQFEWLSGIPGTPKTAEGTPTREYVVGLGEMYVADRRFGANYGGPAGAEFVRDALRVYAERRL